MFALVIVAMTGCQYMGWHRPWHFDPDGSERVVWNLAVLIVVTTCFHLMGLSHCNFALALILGEALELGPNRFTHFLSAHESVKFGEAARELRSYSWLDDWLERNNHRNRERCY